MQKFFRWCELVGRAWISYFYAVPTLKIICKVITKDKENMSDLFEFVTVTHLLRQWQPYGVFLVDLEQIFVCIVGPVVLMETMS